jgi:hypothetical protein
MKFRVPFQAHSKRAKTKAHLMLKYERRDAIGGRDPLGPADGCDSVVFEAHTFGKAMLMVQELILPGDPRPLMGRTNISYFRVEEKPDETHA